MLLKVDKQLLINAMVENQGECDIAVIKDERTDKIEVVAYQKGWINTYCDQNQKELIEKFSHNPGDNGYGEENEYLEPDADFQLDNMEFKNIELV